MVASAFLNPEAPLAASRLARGLCCMRAPRARAAFLISIVSRPGISRFISTLSPERWSLPVVEFWISSLSFLATYADRARLAVAPWRAGCPFGPYWIWPFGLARAAVEALSPRA
jgi:hypothetical protein